MSIVQWDTEPECDHLAARMAAHGAHSFFVSIISFQEQVLGWNAYLNRAKDGRSTVHAYGRLQKILNDFARLQIISFDEPASEVFNQLKAARVRISTMDLRIAAICLTHGFTLLTRNLVDFRQVPNLRVEDWTLPPLKDH